jgi:deoxyribonuclease V
MSPEEVGSKRMIGAFDVHYLKDGRASTAAVLFPDYAAPEPTAVYTRIVSQVEDYLPGEFYRRELPCILTLIKEIREALDEMLVDGYVMLGKRPGLGQYLYESFACKIPVIGVAKSRFNGAPAAEVYRGKSKNPLYVTSAGMGLQEACERIRSMHGPYRVPTLLKQVDLLARRG